MNGQPDPSELGPLAEGLEGIMRELDAFADETRLAPPADLADRIMAAVADEPVPTPPVTFLHAVGALALVDAWRAWRLNLQVALGQGSAPGRLRLQALAVVVIAALLVGIGGSTVAVGAARLVQGLVTPSVTDLDTTPEPSGLEASPQPRPSPSVSPNPQMSPDDSAEPIRERRPVGERSPGRSERGPRERGPLVRRWCRRDGATATRDRDAGAERHRGCGRAGRSARDSDAQAEPDPQADGYARADVDLGRLGFGRLGFGRLRVGRLGIRIGRIRLLTTEGPRFGARTAATPADARL